MKLYNLQFRALVSSAKNILHSAIVIEPDEAPRTKQTHEWSYSPASGESWAHDILRCFW